MTLYGIFVCNAAIEAGKGESLPAERRKHGDDAGTREVRIREDEDGESRMIVTVAGVPVPPEPGYIRAVPTAEEMDEQKEEACRGN